MFAPGFEGEQGDGCALAIEVAFHAGKSNCIEALLELFKKLIDIDATNTNLLGKHLYPRCG